GRRTPGSMDSTARRRQRTGAVHGRPVVLGDVPARRRGGADPHRAADRGDGLRRRGRCGRGGGAAGRRRLKVRGARSGWPVAAIHAILTSLGTDGDVIPYLALGARLRERGHRVTLVAGEPYRSAAGQRGLGFHALISDAETRE